jgi:enoyl-CoA hydratase/carnithine racemase
MSEELVLYHADGNIGIITLNRPTKLNAISEELQQQLEKAFVRADEDPETAVVVLRAEGRSFCVGYDIGSEAQEGSEHRHDALRRHVELDKCLTFEMAPWYMRKPVIASVQGHALGGGCELAMFCDLTIAADTAQFGEPEIRFSVAGPAIVMPWLIGYKKARELLYLGDMIDAQTALDLGMINRIVPAQDLKEATLKYARRLALISPEALAATKLSINRGADASGFRSALQAGLDVLAPLYAAKTELGSQFVDITRKEGLAAALKWRGAQFKE